MGDLIAIVMGELMVKHGGVQVYWLLLSISILLMLEIFVNLQWLPNRLVEPPVVAVQMKVVE